MKIKKLRSDKRFKGNPGHVRKTVRIPMNDFIQKIHDGFSLNKIAIFFGISRGSAKAHYERFQRMGINLNKGKVVGRKLFDGMDEQDIVNKLEYVWALGGSDDEACAYANISKAVYFNYIASNEQIKERRNTLRHRPSLQARMVIVRDLYDRKIYDKKGKEINVIRADSEFALKYAKAKMSDEFSERLNQHHTGNIGNVNNLTDEQVDERIDLLMERLNERIKKSLEVKENGQSKEPKE